MINIVRNNINFILYFGVLIYSIFFTTRFFGTNDDMLMMLYVSGAYTGDPSEYIVYQNILIGHFLKFLYTFNTNINWYVLLFDFVQILSFTALYLLMKKLFNKTTFFFLFILPMLYFIIEMTVYLQFTKVAFISAIVGILYIFYSLHINKSRYLFFSFIFLVLAYLVREQSVYGSVLLSLPIGIFLFIKYKQHILNIKFIIFIVLLSLTFFSLKTYNHHYYDNPSEWKNFKGLIDTRGVIYYDRSITKKCFEKNGKSYNLSRNDVETFYKWTNDDIKVYTPEMLSHISKTCSHGMSYKFKKLLNPNFLKLFIERLFSFNFIFIFIFYIYLLILIDKKYKPYISLYFLFFISILLYLFTIVFDNRVISSLSLEFYLMILMFSYIIKTKKYYIYNQLLTFLSIFIFLLFTYIHLFIPLLHKKVSFSIDTEKTFLKGNYVIIAKSNNFFNSLNIDNDFKQIFKDIKFYYSGWNLSSPDNMKAIDGITNFYELAIQKENVIFYIDDHRLPILRQYFLEHFQKKIYFYKLRNNYYKIKIDEKYLQ